MTFELGPMSRGQNVIFTNISKTTRHFISSFVNALEVFAKLTFWPLDLGLSSKVMAPNKSPYMISYMCIIQRGNWKRMISVPGYAIRPDQKKLLFYGFLGQKNRVGRSNFFYFYFLLKPVWTIRGVFFNVVNVKILWSSGILQHIISKSSTR